METISKRPFGGEDWKSARKKFDLPLKFGKSLTRLSRLSKLSIEDESRDEKIGKEKWHGNGKLNSRRKRCSGLVIFPVAPNGTEDARIKYAF